MQPYVKIVFSAQLEKREYYKNDDGEEKMGKAKGMNLNDLDIIWTQAEEIEKLMDKNVKQIL